MRIRELIDFFGKYMGSKFKTYLHQRQYLKDFANIKQSKFLAE